MNNKEINILKKLFAVLLLVVFLLISIGGCKQKTDDESEDNIQIGKNTENAYCIVYPGGDKTDAFSAATYLRDSIEEKTGVLLEVYPDFSREESPYEILVGKTNRTFSQDVYDSDLRLNDSLYSSNQSQIAFIGGNADSIKQSMDAFIEQYFRSDKAIFSVPQNVCKEYRYDYQIKSLLIDEKNVKDYVIASSPYSKASATILQQAIADKVGYMLPIEMKSSDSRAEIKIGSSGETSDFALSLQDKQEGYICENNTLRFSCGLLVAEPQNSVEAFVKQYLTECSGDVSMMKNSKLVLDDEIPGISFADDAYLLSLEKNAKNKKDQILSSSPVLTNYSRIIYVSESGNDSNNGLSPEKAWKSLDKVNSAVKSGDAVLFECGGKWRGVLWAKPGVMYSHYGNGDMPILCGSKRNYAEESLWIRTSTPNVYKCTQSFSNVGIIAFDHSGEMGDYHAIVGTTVAVEGKVSSAFDLKRDLQFFSDMQEKTLYLYSDKGNPGVRFQSIEIGDGNQVVGLTGNNITIDGLRIQYSGNFGISSGDISGATIKNCVIEWIGGSVNGSAGSSIYGNGIQLYGNVSNCEIKNNWCYQCFDTGITVQFAGKTQTKDMNNVSISDNLVEYCHWGIEYYNLSETGTFKNVSIDRNFIRFNGMGWGEVDRLVMCNGNQYLAEQTASICCFGIKEDSKDVWIRNNVIECSEPGALIRVDNKGFTTAQYDGNTFIQSQDSLMIKLGNDKYLCNAVGARALSGVLKDQNYRLYIIKK